MNEQAEQVVGTILDRAELGDRPLDTDLIGRLIRAAYATGYQDALTEERPWPLTRATAYRVETWARLPTT